MSIEIELDNNSISYLAGDEITGKVLANFPDKRTIRSISVEFTGITSVSWHNYYMTNFTSSQTHFKHLITLHGEQFREKNVHMEPGDYKYPFQYILPASLPSSFEGQHGCTKYFIEASINIPWDKEHVLSSMKLINVNAIVALDSLVKAHRPLSLEINDKTYGKIVATASAPVSGFTKEEDVLFEVSVKNQSKLDISDVLLEIHRLETYNSNKPYWCTKTEMVLLQETNLGSVEANKFKNMETTIVVPDLIPSGLGYCPILDLEYMCRIVCRLSNRNELFQSCVVFIGTIPLVKIDDSPGSSEQIYF